jgi:tRNA (mo5U34)-methyltransferase
MERSEIISRINSFPNWHYQFEIQGILTPVFDKSHINRHKQRKGYFFDPVVQQLGGSLAGKRVLDLACNAGFWSLCALQSGCEFVVGIDGRQLHIDQANFICEAEGIESSRYSFLCGNIFDIDLSQFGSFDLVFCLGLMYHVSKPMELIEKICEVNSDILIIDTFVLGVPGSFLGIRRNRLEEPRSSVDYELVFLPTKQCVLDIVEQFGYSVSMLKPDFQDYAGALDYKLRQRRAFLCAKKTVVTKWSVAVEANSMLSQLADPLFLVSYILRRSPSYVRRRFARLKSCSSK